MEKESSEDKIKREEKIKQKELKAIKRMENKIKKVEKEKEKCKKQNVEYIEEEPKEDPGKAKRIRVYFNDEQHKILKKWFGVRRWIYNKCLDAIYNKGIKQNMDELRKNIINNSNYETENSWMLQYNYDLRDEAMRDLLKNLKSNQAKDKSFKMKYKSKKDMTVKNESISVLGKYWNKSNNFYSDIFRPENIKTTEKLPEKLLYSSRLLRTPTNKFYFCIPEPLELRGENQAPEKSMIFIDPGVKTFITGYDPSGKIIICGERDIGRISRLQHCRNKLQGRIKKEQKHKKRYKMRLAGLKIGEKIRNLTGELHKKVSKWLCDNYEIIYLPRMNFHNFKNLNKKSKAKMAAYSHCSFSDRVLNKAREYPSCKVYEVNESYTSKTCSKCGNIDDKLGNKDIYNCKVCNLKIGRDINASKNIMLRYFSKRAVVY